MSIIELLLGTATLAIADMRECEAHPIHIARLKLIWHIAESELRKNPQMWAEYLHRYESEADKKNGAR